MRDLFIAISYDKFLPWIFLVGMIIGLFHFFDFHRRL